MILPYEDFLTEQKRKYIIQLMLECKGHQSKAAELAKVHRNTIKRLILEVGINLSDVRRVKRQSYMADALIPRDL